MKDAKGHGSDPRGAHSAGVQQVPVMTISQHLAMHEAKMAAKSKALAYRQNRNKERGYQAFLAGLK